MERAISRLPGACIILMAASLLAFQPGGLFRFVWVKLVVVILAVLAGLLSPVGARLPLAVKAMTAACVLWIAVAMLLSDTPLASIAGRWPRYEGLPTLAVYMAVFAIGAKVLGGSAGTPRRALLSLSLAVAGIALFVIAALEGAGLRPLGGAEDVRPGATPASWLRKAGHAGTGRFGCAVRVCWPAPELLCFPGPGLRWRPSWSWLCSPPSPG
jgi:hypothetical protein